MEGAPPDQRSSPEIVADVAFRGHGNCVVQIIGYTARQGSTPAKKEFLGSGFIIEKKEEVTRTCLVITCDHVLQHKYDSVLVRLSNTNEDLQATARHRDHDYDLAVLRVQGKFQAHHSTIGLTDGSAVDIAVGTLVALVSYYNPCGLPINEPLFPLVPGAYGGYIQGARIDKARKGIKLAHGCYGIQGSSGGPLICHDTQHAFGVFQETINQVHMAISTQTVHDFLKLWLIKHTIQVGDNDTIQQTLIKCQRLY